MVVVALGVASMVDKKRKARLGCFEHVKSKCIDTLMISSNRLVIEGTVRGRGRQKKYPGEVISQDMIQF